MAKIKENDDQEVLKLDQHFKRILMRVRSYVLNLRSVKEAYLCGIWLEKLNSVTSQRNLRNEYLLELSRQLRTGVLEGIFKTQPPDDLLMPLSSSSSRTDCITSSVSELSDYDENNRNCLMLGRKSNQRNHLQDKIKFHDSNSSICASVYAHYDKDTVEKNHPTLCEYYIDTLTGALENLRIQNERLKRELTKCQGKTTDNKAFRSRNRVRQLMTEARTQSLVWKVQMLKRTVAKLRKLNNTIEQIYEKKLQRIIRNKNLKIKILQLQFQQQTSELCLSLYSEKQNELYSLVGSLEENYKVLLAAANANVESQRQEYFTKIGMLETELCHLRNKFGSKPKYI